MVCADREAGWMLDIGGHNRGELNKVETANPRQTPVMAADTSLHAQTQALPSCLKIRREQGEHTWVKTAGTLK